MDDQRIALLVDGEELDPCDPPVVAPATLPRLPRVVTVVTTWSDGTVHIARPGEPVQVVVPLGGA